MTFLELIRLFSNIILFVLATSIILYAINWKKEFKIFNYLFFYLVLNISIELLADVFQNRYGNNLPLLHIYTLGEFLLFSFFYKNLFYKKISIYKYINVFILIITMLIILNSVFLQSIFLFNSYAKSLVQCILILYSLIYFIGIDARIEERSVGEKGRLLVNTGVLIYYSGSLFIFMFSDFFNRNGSGLPEYFWMFNVVLNLIFQLLILSAIWMVFRSKKSISS